MVFLVVRFLFRGGLHTVATGKGFIGAIFGGAKSRMISSRKKSFVKRQNPLKKGMEQSCYVTFSQLAVLR